MCFVLILLLCVSQWFEDKFQEVENEEQQLRKLQAVVDSLVNHRKGELRRSLSAQFFNPIVPVAVQLPGLCNKYTFFCFQTQSCVAARQYLPKVWPCWETLRTTQRCRGPCPSWQRWRTRWSSCIRSRQPVTSSSLQSCWPTTFAYWVLCG